MSGNQSLNGKQNDTLVGCSNKQKVVELGKFENAYFFEITSTVFRWRKHTVQLVHCLTVGLL